LPIEGRAAVVAEWQGYLKFMKSYDYKFSHTLSSGNAVMVERVEWIGTKKGKTIELPIVGVFELSGGNIRSIALTSAYLAAEEKRDLEMADLIRAVHREYRKLGRLSVRSEFGEWFEVVQSEIGE